MNVVTGMFVEAAVMFGPPDIGEQVVDMYECGSRWSVAFASKENGRVQVNMYLAHPPSRENKAIDDIRREAPRVLLNVQRHGSRAEGGLHWRQGLRHRTRRTFR